VSSQNSQISPKNPNNFRTGPAIPIIFPTLPKPSHNIPINQVSLTNYPQWNYEPFTSINFFIQSGDSIENFVEGKINNLNKLKKIS
jgi:hypothetical protein